MMVLQNKVKNVTKQSAFYLTVIMCIPWLQWNAIINLNWTDVLYGNSLKIIRNSFWIRSNKAIPAVPACFAQAFNNKNP